MLRFLGSSHTFCDGASRRDFLQIGAFGAGLTLADMLRLRTASAATSKKQPARSQKAAIMIYLPGGPSHMDMYDLKPDAPKEFRGEFNPIDTNVAGVQICEHFPLQAKMWDKLACVRSLVTVDEHSDTMVMTGYPDRVNATASHPSFGSVVSKVRNSTSGAVPPFVSLRGMSRGTEPGYLGIAHRPFTPSGPGNQNLRLANGVTPAATRRSEEPAGRVRRHAPRHRRQRHDERDGRVHREGHRDGDGRRGPRCARSQEGRPEGRRAIQGCGTVPHRAATSRSGRRLRYAFGRRLGHARPELPDAQAAAAAAWTRASRT